MFRLEMLPAGHGDCLWIEYGNPAAPRRVLIDGGARGTYQRALRERLGAIPEAERRVELAVVTHIDADHITGVLDLLEDRTTRFEARDFWFNGYRHLPNEGPETLGPVQGEKLTDLLVTRPWNRRFNRAAVVVPASGDLPRVELEGGLVLTLLSPTTDKLAELKPDWEKEVRKAGLDPDQPRPDEIPSEEGVELLGEFDLEALAEEPFVEDSAPANGSSIAMLAEFEGRRLLLTGDAHPGLLTTSITRLTGGDVLRVDACKLPHHGSKFNVSEPFLQALDCRLWLFSSNGAHFKHPDAQAVARVIKFGGAQPELRFNYRTRYTNVWGAASLREEYRYQTSYPNADAGGAIVEW